MLLSIITEGLELLYTKGLVNISNENAQDVIDFILNTKIEQRRYLVTPYS
jgi:hypothetical protein